MNFLGELKRRNVIRMAGLYVVGAWLIVQVAETLLPIFDTPGWVLKALVMLLALGFVPVLVFSWVYELTPEGLKRERDLDQSRPASDFTTRRLDMAIIVLLLVSIGLVAWNRLHPAAPLPVSTKPELEQEAALGPHSIAVLPFESFSAAEEDALFADGLADTILHKLAQLRQLRVIARNSSFAYKGGNVDVRKVGSELGVASVLEGSVQRQGARLRVIAQLVETRSGSHLWSRTYDRPLADLFAIQDEIAAAVVRALEVELLAGDAAVLSAVDGVNTEAQEKLLAVRQFRNAQAATWHTNETLSPWRTMAQDAVRADPRYADAWIELATAEQVMAWRAPDGTARRQAIDRGYAALRRALELQPDSVEALKVMSSLLLREGRNAESLALNLSLLERAPNDASSMRRAALNLWSLMRPGEALVLQERALALDPLSPAATRQRGISLILLGRLDEARENHKAGIVRWPEFTVFHYDLAWIEGGISGQWADSFVWLLQGIDEAPEDLELPVRLAHSLQLLGLTDAAERWAAYGDERLTGQARAEAAVSLHTLQARYAEALAVLSDPAAILDDRWLRDRRGYLALLHLLAADEEGAREQLAIGLEELGNGLDGVFLIGTSGELRRAALLGLVASRQSDARGPTLLRLALERLRELPAQGYAITDSLHYAEGELLAALGQPEAALSALEQALPEDKQRVLLNSLAGLCITDSPFLDSLHAEPRFRALMAEIERRRQAAGQRVTALLAAHQGTRPR